MKRMIAMFSLGCVVAAMVLIVVEYVKQPSSSNVSAPQELALQENTEASAPTVPAESVTPADTTTNAPLAPSMAKEETVVIDLGTVDENATNESTTQSMPVAETAPQEPQKFAVANSDDKTRVVSLAPAKEQNASSAVVAEQKTTVQTFSKATAVKATTSKTTAMKQSSAKATGVFTMKSAGFRFDGTKAIFVVTADKPFTAKVFKLLSPERIVIDLSGKWLHAKEAKTPSNLLVQRVRLGINPNSVRYVLDAKKNIKTMRQNMNGNTFSLILE